MLTVQHALPTKHTCSVFATTSSFAAVLNKSYNSLHWTANLHASYLHASQLCASHHSSCSLYALLMSWLCSLWRDHYLSFSCDWLRRWAACCCNQLCVCWRRLKGQPSSTSPPVHQGKICSDWIGTIRKRGDSVLQSAFYVSRLEVSRRVASRTALM